MPSVIRGSGIIKPGSKFADLVSGEDWSPTLLAAAGEPDIKKKLLSGHKAGNRTHEVRLDGFDQTDYLSGKADESARKGFMYISDVGDLLALQKEVARILETFEQFPPRQKPASFTVGEAIEALSPPAAPGK